MSEQEYLTIHHIMNLRTKYVLSKLESEFAAGLRKGKILAARCPNCKRFMIPPRLVCGLCDTRVEREMVEQSDRGRVINAVKLEMKQVDAETGEIKEFPYPMGAVELETGGRMDCNFGEEVTKLQAGAPVEAVWKPKEEREGKLTDILYFKPINA